MTEHDDLHPEPTEGFKVGEKKTIDEYQQLGACHPPPHLPSLRRALRSFSRQGPHENDS
jgi:hypothetical protein